MIRSRLRLQTLPYRLLVFAALFSPCIPLCSYLMYTHIHAPAVQYMDVGEKKDYIVVFVSTWFLEVLVH